MVCFPYSSQSERGRAGIRACHSVNDVMALSKYFSVSLNTSQSGLESESVLVGRNPSIFSTMVSKIILDQRVYIYIFRGSLTRKLVGKMD